MIRKLFSVALTLAVAVTLLGPSIAKAATAEDLQAQIDTLLAQLSTLQAQLATLQGGTTGGTIAGCTITSFDRNLSVGMTGDDVKCLQIVLNSAADTKLADSGVGSAGNETTYFGPLTKAAVIKFQEKYASEVLASWGLTSGTGYVGSTTRAKLDTLLVTVPDDDDDDDDDGDVTPVTGSTLNVKLAADTPASNNIATGANANFTKVILTAGDEDVSISKIYVTRSGLSTNSNVENIKFYDADGTLRGSIGSLNTNSKAMITFSPNLVIEAGESEAMYIRAGVASGATAGNTASLGIASVDDIICDAETVSGDLPATGNAMTFISLTIGTAVFLEDGSTIDSAPDVGDTDVVVNKFTVSAGSTEAIVLEALSAMEVGSAALDDVENVELYSVTEGKSLSEVKNWSNEGKVTWTDLNIEIGKGETHRFEIRVDIIDGAGLTVNADYEDGSDVLASVKGQTYGFYITPSDAGDGKGANNQTINSGALTIAKSASTPATGNIAPGDDQTLTTWDFIVKGEEVKISALTLTFTTSSGAMQHSEVTNVKVYDEDGTIVCGPKDLTAAKTVAFTDVFIVPVGTHQYTVKVKIANTVATGEDVYAGIATPNSQITAKGMTSNDDITPSPTTAVNGNNQTVAAGALTATTLSDPAARSVAKGITDFIFMTANLSAAASGEDVLVSSIVIEDTVNATASISELDSMELWADLTSADSARGDVYETKISDTYNPTGTGTSTDTNQTFAISPAMTISKGTYVKIALVADLSTGAGAYGTHAVSIDRDANDVTASGASTGQTITVAAASGDGQAMTTASSGTLTVSLDSSSPSTALMVDETLHTLGIFKFAANNVENLDIDSIKVTSDGADDAMAEYYFYSNERSDGNSISDPIGTAVGYGDTAEILLADDTVIIPANDYVLITVKGKTANVDGTAVQNNDAIEATIAATGDVDTTGKASGAAVDSTDTSVDAATHRLYESYPIFAVNSSSPSGTLVPSANMLLAIIDVTAAGNKDVTWDGAADPDGGTENDLIYVSISALDGGSTPASINIIVKDQDGNVLDDPAAASTTNITVDFTTKDFVVPAGQTKKLYFYVDSTGYTTTGDTLQLYLDDYGKDIIWSVNYDDGDYTQGSTTFKGKIYAGAFVK
jgi:hypothetical protein